ncbi:MAG: hypothetical protein PF489_09575 [Salinivirgaceae bacterium]|nr:hypothetical protein [Salinivirgaceae bacterium]
MRQTKVFFRLLIFAIIAVLFAECNNQEIKKISQERPYAIKVKSERSFFQALKIRDRLHDMDFQAYLVEEDDTANGGKWYHVVCEALGDTVALTKQLQRYDSVLQIETLEPVELSRIHQARIGRDSIRVEEKQRIKAQKPDVPTKVYDVIQKFPESNALFLRQMYVVNSPDSVWQKEHSVSMNSFKLDLPRGITRSLMLEKTTAFSEAIYEDNLYGDLVTLDIAKLRKKYKIINRAGYSLAEAPQYAVADFYAEKILSTGNYITEKKEKLKIDSYTTLRGYKVMIEPEKGYLRTYLVLVDDAMQYLFFSQSTDKTIDELTKILANAGKSNGLINYDEFYNMFYTMPAQMVDGDVFLGFAINKVQPSYAHNRGNARWAREIVGHWDGTAYFSSKTAGLWIYGLFDLLTNRKQDYIYNDLYAGAPAKNKIRIELGGVAAFVLKDTKIDWDTYKTYTKVSEINFGVMRYVCTINNTTLSWLTQTEMEQRAVALQIMIPPEPEDELEKPAV